ncbi:hypothetical protein BSL78_13280 [Apostichopus japonicus]|uniref:Ig-like domain-containing protein n=1 Tax=Stichopus japonicus TaxID=307972 RepID=A0A2G8KPE8_STIJA|nr:hypothetical protein BSL78_13280 [Apostichopus japonicus]
MDVGQALCGYNCTSYCNEANDTLDCSGLGLSNFSVCGNLEYFQQVNFVNNNITDLATPLHGGIYDFSHNQIATVDLCWEPRACISDTYLLINLSHNAIQRLPEGAIALNLTCDAMVKHVRIVLDLSSNDLSYVEHEAMSMNVSDECMTQRVTMDLSFNKLVNIHLTAVRIVASSIREIYLLLNNNDLTNFTAVSSFVDNDRNGDVGNYVINLHGNNISGFQEEDIENVHHDNVTLILDENPWNCDCSQRYVSLTTSRLRRFLNNNNSVEPICEIPAFVNGRPLSSLSKNEFICGPKLDQNANLTLEVLEGSTLILLCPVTGADPPIVDVDWQIPVGNPAQGEVTSSIHVRTCLNCSLVINNIHEDLEGDYLCTVSNGQNLTIVQTVMVDDEIRSPNTEGTFKRPLLIAIILLSVILVIVVVCLAVVCYKLYKTKENEAPLPRRSINDDVTNNTFANREDCYLAPREFNRSADNEDNLYDDCHTDNNNRF